MLLGPASAAVQRAGAGRSGRSCQQADGQVCRKVSTETALPVREGANNGGKTLGPNRPTDPFSHILRVEGGGINHFSLHNKSWLLTWQVTALFNGAVPVEMANTTARIRGGGNT